jgi:hypothetical protein
MRRAFDETNDTFGVRTEPSYLKEQISHGDVVITTNVGSWEELMRKSLQCVLVGLAAISGLTISPTIAAAQDLELRVGPGGVGVYDRNRDRDRYDGYDRRGPRGCDPDDALDIARSEGLRRAQIVRMSPRSIVVQGMTRRGPERMTFANRRGCPEI